MSGRFSFLGAFYFIQNQRWPSGTLSGGFMFKDSKLEKSGLSVGNDQLHQHCSISKKLG